MGQVRAAVRSAAVIHSVNLILLVFSVLVTDVAKVLVGIQVPQSTAQDFEAFLSKLAYHYTEETDNAVFKRFLH